MGADPGARSALRRGTAWQGQRVGLKPSLFIAPDSATAALPYPARGCGLCAAALLARALVDALVAYGVHGAAVEPVKIHALLGGGGVQPDRSVDQPKRDGALPKCAIGSHESTFRGRRRLGPCSAWLQQAPSVSVEKQRLRKAPGAGQSFSAGRVGTDVTRVRMLWMSLARSSASANPSTAAESSGA